MTVDDSFLLRSLPQMGRLLEGADFARLQQTYPRPLLTASLRSILHRLRHEIVQGRHTDASLEQRLAKLPETVEAELQRTTRFSLRPVINATGVILQTNLGRAPLSMSAIAHLSEIAGGYSNLELDLESGQRGSRDVHAEQLILALLAQRQKADLEDLSGRAALVVNNCAAACLLALNSLAEGGEVLVSRGELVEIGGGFRVPDILRKSGAVLREVGTTNRTRIADYETAITPATRMILRVHRSNFEIIGYTGQPSLMELEALSRRANIPLFEDQGTGAVVDLAQYGLPGESQWVRSAAGAVSLVACSGDKLLGGPQCGILVGDRAYLELIRSNPLFRALRADKLTYAALEATLLAYLTGEEESLPVVAMLQTSPEVLRQRCELVVEQLAAAGVTAAIVASRSVVGGGTTPGASLPGFAVSVRHPTFSESALAARLRGLSLPVMARTQEGSLVADLRTVFPHQDEALIAAISHVIKQLSEEIPH